MNTVYLRRPASAQRLAELTACAGVLVQFKPVSAAPAPGHIWLDPEAALPQAWLRDFARALDAVPVAARLQCLSNADAQVHPTGARVTPLSVASHLTSYQMLCQRLGREHYSPVPSVDGPLLGFSKGWQPGAPELAWAGMYAHLASPDTDAQWVAQVPWLSQLQALLSWPKDTLPPAMDLPVVLHVLHGWGGGAASWVRNFALADPERCHLVLQAERVGSNHGARLRLGLAADPNALFFEQTLQPAIQSTLEVHLHYRALVDSWLSLFQVQAVWVSSLIGHALDILHLSAERKLPLTWITHDYYPLWPHLHADFGDAALGFDLAALHAPGANAPGANAAGPIGKLEPDAFWRLRAHVVAALRSAHLVAPSHATQRNWLRMAPELSDADWRVLAHGADWPQPVPSELPTDETRAAPVLQPKLSRRLRLLVLGRVQGAKGEDLLLRALPELSQYCELWLLGCGSGGLSLMGRNHVHVISDFERAELPGWIARIKPDAALLPRTVAETYSYVLSECWALKMPVLAARLGSLEERIEHAKTGLLFAPNAEALCALVRALAQDRSVLGQLQAGTLLSSADMLAGYLPLLPRARAATCGASDQHALQPEVMLGNICAGLLQSAAFDLRAGLLEREAALAHAQLELERRGNWGHELSELLAARTAWAQQLQQSVDYERAQREQTEMLRAEALHQQAQLQAQLAHSEQIREQTQIQLGDQLQQAQEYIAMLLASTSWRLTAPLRLLALRLLAVRSKLALGARSVRNLVRRAWQSLRVRGLRATLQRARSWLKPVQPIHHNIETEPLAEVGALFVPFEFPHHAAPRVSIVIPVYNKWPYTEACLRSLQRVQDATAFEVIVVDDGSSDETAERLAQIAGVIAQRNPENLGFIGACNRGLALARGEYVFFLNNDTQVQAHFLETLLDTFAQHPEAGLVGSKLIYPDGRMQECGGIVFRDGSGWNYGRFDDPEDCRYSFLREADYVSGAAILLPIALARQLGGFDSYYAPAYYEDTDLAFRVRALGRRVYVQPLSRVVHFEGITGGTDLSQGTKRFQVLNQQKFFARWESVLRQHVPSPPHCQIERARQQRALRHVLVIDACTPMPDQDSGSVRMFEWLRLMLEEGAAVTFFAENRAYHQGYAEALQALGVEVLYHPYLPNIADFMAAQAARFDLVILSRYYVAEQFMPLVKRYAPKAEVWFDTVDLHYLRERREAELRADPAALRQAAATKKRELALMRLADLTLVVSPVEQALLLRDCPGAKVAVLSNIHRVPGRRASFLQRKDVFFVGGFQHPPNVDAVLWFAREIWPLVHAQLGEARWHIVGSKTPPEISALAGEHILVHGFLPDLEPLLDGCRLSVAPLRYGAGVKGKVNMSMSYGCPVVATGMAVEGMYLVAGRDVLVADAAADFAHKVVALYQDTELWQALSDASLENVEAHFSLTAARAKLKQLWRQAEPEQGAVRVAARLP